MLDGYLDRRSDTGEKKGTLRICVSNIKEFEDLIEKVKKEADQLQHTIHQLRSFYISFEVEAKEPTSEK